MLIHKQTEIEQSDQTEATLQVVADDREGASDVVARLQDLDHVHLNLKRLSIGDYEVENRVLFERKTVLDFAASIRDGRLFSQAARLISCGWSVAIIVEGTRDDLATTEMRRESLQGAMVSLTLIWEIPVLRSLSPMETANLILYAAEQLRRQASGTVTRHGRKAKRKERLQLQVLQSLPGIGPDRAKLLLQTFGSVGAVMNANADEFTQIPGIGDKTAQGIVWILGRDPET